MEIIGPFTKEQFQGIKVGTMVYLTGTIYTARDAAHKRMIQMLDEGKQLPFDVENQILYYVGPTPAKEDEVIGSCGPTTSSRMDVYTPTLYQQGLIATIGKGYRSEAVIKSQQEYNTFYFVAIGGAGAYMSQCVKKAECIAFEDLGPEGIYKLEVERFPVLLCIDNQGNNYYFLKSSEMDT